MSRIQHNKTQHSSHLCWILILAIISVSSYRFLLPHPSFSLVSISKVLLGLKRIFQVLFPLVCFILLLQFNISNAQSTLSCCCSSTLCCCYSLTLQMYKLHYAAATVQQYYSMYSLLFAEYQFTWMLIKKLTEHLKSNICGTTGSLSSNCF